LLVIKYQFIIVIPKDDITIDMTGEEVNFILDKEKLESRVRHRHIKLVSNLQEIMKKAIEEYK